MAYNLKRKADRQKAADQLAAAMLEAGATAVNVAPCAWSPRELRVTIDAPGGASINVSLDGDLPDVIGGTWNTPQGVYLNPVLGDVNPHHYGKLNVYGYGDDLDRLTARLAQHLQRFADGSGYLTADSPQLVAMAARYAAQGWTFNPPA